MKQYKTGMYGGKFMPLHKGHNYCIETACAECEKVYVILFFGGADEMNILQNNKEEYLTVSQREKHPNTDCATSGFAPLLRHAHVGTYCYSDGHRVNRAD